MSFNIGKAKIIHENKYDYGKVNYINVDTKIIIVCPIHGEFKQTPYHHINRGQGCGKCKGNKISKTKRFNIEEFIVKSNEIHKFKYDYTNALYVNAHKPLTILCPIHGAFEQRPNNHIYGKHGCPNCGYNVSKTSDMWLDSLKVDKKFREKIITINGVRYKVDAYVPSEKTIYEYFGYFWHGHPDYFKSSDINPKNKISFGELYAKTLMRIETIKNNGYILIFKWGD